jgi:hypothetical protein
MIELTKAQQRTFRDAVRDAGVDPKETCPLCREPVRHAHSLYPFDRERAEWGDTPTGDEYACRGCGVRYRVARAKVAP